MASKRKREETTQSNSDSIPKALSAIVAARRIGRTAAEGIAPPEVALGPAPDPTDASGLISGSENEESVGELDQVPIKHSVKLCNWRHDPSDILSDTNTELTINLNKHTTVAVLGCFRLKILKGAVHINGANIGTISPGGQKDKVYYVYVPATHPILKIRGLDGTNHVQLLTCDTPTPLADVSPLFSSIWMTNAVHMLQRSFIIVSNSDADPLARPLNPDLAPEDWLRAVEDCARTTSVSMVVGPSNSGKSVYSKRLINRHLTGMGKSAPPVPHVGLLDLNPMKQEYGPPGRISLVLVQDINLAPAFTHPFVPSPSVDNSHVLQIRAHPVTENLGDYMNYFEHCVRDLLLAFKNLEGRDQSLPLVIDTSGSLYDSGFDILIRLLDCIKPHNIIHINDSLAADIDSAVKLNLLQTQAHKYNGTVRNIAAQGPPVPSLRSEADLIHMQMQSYFHLKRSSAVRDGHVQLKWTSNPVLHLVPWEFCYQETSKRHQDFIGFAMYAEPSDNDSIVHALVGSIVQVVTSTSSKMPIPYTSLPRTSIYGIPYFPREKRQGTVSPLDPTTTSLICTAILREINPVDKTVQLIIPDLYRNVMQGLNAERTVMVGGCSALPEWAFLERMNKGYSILPEVCDMECSKQYSNYLEQEAVIGAAGYLNTVRRVRKFQT